MVDAEFRRGTGGGRVDAPEVDDEDDGPETEPDPATDVGPAPDRGTGATPDDPEPPTAPERPGADDVAPDPGTFDAERAIEEQVRSDIADAERGIERDDLDVQIHDPTDYQRRATATDVTPTRAAQTAREAAVVEAQLTDDARERIASEQQEDEGRGGAMGWVEDRADDVSQFGRAAGDTVEDVVPSRDIGIVTSRGAATFDTGWDEVAGDLTQTGVEFANIPGHALLAEDVGRAGARHTWDVLSTRRGVGFAGTTVPTADSPDTGGQIAEGAADVASDVSEAFWEEPARTTIVGAGTAGLAVAGPSAAARGARGLRARAPDTGPRHLGLDDRGQLDFAGAQRTQRTRQRTTPEDVVDVRSPDYDPRITEGVGRRQTGRVDPDDIVPEVGAGGPRAGLGERRQLAAEIREYRRQELGIETATASPGGQQLVAGALTRREAAAAPGWLSASVVPSGETEDLPTFEEAQETVTPTVTQEDTDADLETTTTAVTREDELTDMVEAAEEQQVLAEDDTLTAPTDQTAPPGTVGLGALGVGVGTRTDVFTDQRLGQRTLLGTRAATRGATRFGRPPRRGGRRPRGWWPDGPEAGQADMDFDLDMDFGFDTEPGDRGVGWLSEMVTDIGVSGREAPRAPAEGEFADTELGFEVPTAQLAEGDEDVLEAADLFTFGDGGTAEDEDGWFQW